MQGGKRALGRDTGMPDSEETRELLAKANAGDTRAIEDLFSRHKDRLQRMVHFRMDRRMKPRVDPEDVLQETYVDVVKRLDDFLQEGEGRMDFFLWMRFLTDQKLKELHRRHLGAQRRDARREAAQAAASPDGSYETIAWELAGRITSPSSAAGRAEEAANLRAQLESMDPIDYRVLQLVHFEHLSKAEAAMELGVSLDATKKRYQRAFRKLGAMLGGDA